MVINTVTEAKARLSELIARVQAGEEVIIGKAGKPAAVLRSYQNSSPQRRPGAMRGKMRIAPDFDDLPEDLAEGFAAYDNGLGRHAGDWSEADLQEFEANTRMFHQVDDTSAASAR